MQEQPPHFNDRSKTNGHPKTDIGTTKHSSKTEERDRRLSLNKKSSERNLHIYSFTPLLTTTNTNLSLYLCGDS